MPTGPARQKWRAGFFFISTARRRQHRHPTARHLATVTGDPPSRSTRGAPRGGKLYPLTSGSNPRRIDRGEPWHPTPRPPHRPDRHADAPPATAPGTRHPAPGTRHPAPGAAGLTGDPAAPRPRRPAGDPGAAPGRTPTGTRPRRPAPRHRCRDTPPATAPPRRRRIDLTGPRHPAAATPAA
jgi:hypothetical protein